MGYFFARLCLSLFIVLSTYNPSGYSYFDWVADGGRGPLSLKVTVGLGLVIVYYAVLRIVYGALRRSGLIFGGIAALLFATELVSLTVAAKSYRSLGFILMLAQYVLLIAFALVIAFGVSWSSLIERLTGQLQKRYVRY
ncbi:MAG TPA: DUF6524 family protein [Stellaceae bacterium]|nr:DUF6524 family protein [Stellaceae bacterium]